MKKEKKIKEAEVVDGKLCMRCGNCVENCPVKALSFGSAKGGGCTACVSVGNSTERDSGK